MKRVVFFTALLLAGTVHAALQDGLVSYWPLNDGGGTAAVDVWGEHNGVPQTCQWVGGKLDKAINTNGSGYVVVAEHADLRPSSKVSVQAWVKVAAFSNWAGIAGNFQDNGYNESGYCIYTTTSGIAFYVSTTSGNNFKTASATASTGQWLHVVGVYDGSYVRIYINGQQKAQTAATGNINWNYMPVDFNIGRYHDDNENVVVNSVIDEVALWNRALTSSEVSALYNGGNGSPVANSAYVTLTESDGSTSATEGGSTDSYEVVLGSTPTGDVQITASPANSQIDLGQGSGQAKTLTFTTSNWNTPQSITVTAVDDEVFEGKQPLPVDITHAAQGGGYDGVNIRSITANVIDNEETCGDWGYLPTDLNRDCYVNLQDFAIFASFWLTQPL